MKCDWKWTLRVLFFILKIAALKNRCLLETPQGPRTNKAVFQREWFEKVTFLSQSGGIWNVVGGDSEKASDTQSWSLGKLTYLPWATGKRSVLQWTKINSEPFEVLTSKFSASGAPSPGSFVKTSLLSAGYSHFLKSSQCGTSRFKASPNYSLQGLLILPQDILFQITFIEHPLCVGCFHIIIPALS